MHDNHIDDFNIVSPLALEKTNSTEDLFYRNPVFEAKFNPIDNLGEEEIDLLDSFFEDPELIKFGNIVAPPTPTDGLITKTTIVDVDPIVPSPEQYARSEKKKLSRKGCKSKKNRDFRLKEAEGEWSITKVDACYDGYDVSIQLRTRTEGPTDYVPEIMYSSIQYVFLIHLDALDDTFGDSHPFYARVYLNDAVTGRRLTHDLNNKAPVRGDFEGAVSKKLNGDFKGELKVKFGDLSYNKNPKEYRISVVLFDPKDLDTSLIEIESDIIRIYARKPNKKKRKKKKAPPKKKKTSKKRKRNNDKDENTRAKKKRKFDVFKDKLEEMIEVFGKLNGNDRTSALSMLMNVVNPDDDDFF